MIEVWEVFCHLTVLVESVGRLTRASSARSFVIDVASIGMRERARSRHTDVRIRSVLRV